MSWVQSEVRSLRENRYVLIGDEPCRITSISISKPGKHGEAKARIEAIGVFDGQKKSIVHPVTHRVRVPMIDKRSAQVIALMGSEVQLMDMKTYDTFNMPIEDEWKDKLVPGNEVQYIVAMGRRKITRA